MELILVIASLLYLALPTQLLSVTSQPPLTTVPAGDQLILNCSTPDGAPYWRLSTGVTLPYMVINSSDQLVSSYSLRSAAISDNGTAVQCVANLSNGTQLTPIHVRIGESVILSCHPDAWPLASVSWWHNQSQVSTGNHLIVPALSHEVAGEYRCVAENSQGNATSAGVIVTVSAAKSAAFLFRNESAALNLSCDGIGLTWTKSGAILTPSSLPSGLLLVNSLTQSFLFFSSVSPSLTGTYVCSQQSVTNSKFILNIPTLEDTFQAEPVSQGVFRGQSLSLPCSPPLGAPPPLTTWYLQGTMGPLSNTSQISLLPNGDLLLSNFSQSSAGRYSCVAHNLAGFRSVSADLSLMELPYVAIFPGGGPLYIHSNQPLLLECNISSLAEGVYSWTRNGQLIGYRKQLEATQEGVYRCEVEVATSQSSLFVQSNSLQLISDTSLQFNGSIGAQVVREGDTVSVKCRTSGGTPSFHWFHWTQEVSTGDTLTLVNVTREQAGEYSCVAVDTLMSGTGIKQLFSLTVRYGPFVGAPLNTLMVQEGGIGLLRCEVRGAPPPSVQWFRSDNSTDQLINATLLNNSLQITRAELSDAGTYKCIATDPLDSSNSAYITVQLLVVRSSPPIPPLNNPSLPTVLIPLCLAVSAAVLCVCGTLITAVLMRKCSHGGNTRYQRDLRESEEGTVRSKFSPKALYQPLGSSKPNSGMGSRQQQPEVSFPMIGFPRDELCFGTRLGDGAYGPIIEGSIEEFFGERRHVAVECYISNSEEGSFPKPDELHTWPVFYLHHENLSRVLGICTSVEPYYVIYEYSDRGCLKEFLQTAKEQLITSSPPDSMSRSPPKRQSAVDVHFVLTQAHLLRMCRQAALGLEFLAQRDMVFRDVAARNCCVSSTLDIKLINLPIGPNLFPGDYYRRDKEFLPVRWMSPESLQNSQFTTKSDVWAYGVFCWEVFTYARQPYETQSDEQVLERVPAGLRLFAPEEGCPDGAYRLMKQCWHQSPDKRPSFSSLCVDLHDVSCD